MSDQSQEMKAQIGSILEQYLSELVDDTEMPVLSDWIIVVAVDDAAKPDGGGHYVGIPDKYMHSYRAKGLLVHALDMMREDND